MARAFMLTGLVVALGAGAASPAGAGVLNINWAGTTDFFFTTTGFDFAPQAGVFRFDGASNGTSFIEGTLNLQVRDAATQTWLTISSLSTSSRTSPASLPVGTFDPMTIDGLRFEPVNFGQGRISTGTVFSFTQRDPIEVPEPTAMTLLLSALGLAGLAWRRGATAPA